MLPAQPIRDRITEWVCPVCGDHGEDRPEWLCLGSINDPHDAAEHVEVEYVRRGGS